MRAEQDAWELLRKTWIDEEGSQPRLPVDPVAIARKLGIQVYIDYSLASDVSGMLRKLPGYDDPEILLNGSDSPVRRRFTCAHEIGHYNQRVNQGADGQWEYIDKRDSLASTGKSAEEIYANKFAAELLMPKEVIRERAADGNVVALAVEFGVSADAMRFRLDNLGIG